MFHFACAVSNHRGFAPGLNFAMPVALAVKHPSPVDDPKDLVVQLLTKADEDKQGQVAAADQLEMLLRERSLLYDLTIAPRSVGFDPCNRDGEGGNPLNVIALASEIAACGWSQAEVSKAICAEVVPHDDSVETFNRKLSGDSGMAPVDVNSIFYGSLACGHTNYVLRCISAGVPSTCEYLSENGRMSETKLAQRDHLMAEVVASGLRWKVIRWEVRFLYPTALPFIQRARNIASTMYRKESEIQGLLRLHTLSSAAQKANRDIPWSSIKRSVLRSRPPFADSLDEMIAFIMTRSGGVEGRFLQYLSAFYRNHVDSKRNSIPASLYTALADFPMHYVALAIYQAAWKCPPDAVISGVCKGVTVVEISALVKTADPVVRSRLRAAEVALAEARLRLGLAGVPDDWDSTKLCKILARLDISMARLILDKQATMKDKFVTVAAVGRQFVGDLKKFYPDADASVFDDIFPLEPDDDTAAPGDPAAGKMTLYAVGDAGVVTDPLALLRSKGFDIGSHTVPSAMGASGRETMYQIAAIDQRYSDITVVLRDITSTDITRKVALDAFLASWEHRVAKDLVVLHIGWPSKRPSGLVAVRSIMRRGAIFTSLGHLVQSADYMVEHRVIIYAKPVRKVEASADAASGHVVLLPETNSIKSRARTDDGVEDQKNAGEVVFEPADPDHQYFLMPCCDLERVAPLWCVGSTEDPSEANMGWGTVVVQILMGHDFRGVITPAVVASGRIGVQDMAAESDSQDAVGTAAGKAKGKPAGKAKGKPKAKAQAIPADPVLGVIGTDHPGDEDQATELRAVIPVMLNIKPLRKGDVLLVFKAKAAGKKPREVQPIQAGALAKKAKTKQ